MAAKEYFSLQRQEHRKGCCDMRSGCCACLLFTLIALVIAALVTALIFLIMQVASHKPMVETTCGTVEGKYCPHTDAYIFRGIPYAVPPVGDLRWSAAVPLTKPEEGDEEGAASGACGWEGAMEAMTQKDTCVWIDHGAENTTVVGSEDCLYLNVYSPGGIHEELDANDTYPVVVFIHGEAGVDPKYHPGPKMAGEMQVVFVTLHYRLGALGFLTLDVDGVNTANHGITDQIEALKWVKENIANFGGNVDDVTVVGQGTGGSCVLTLVASPEAKGLFHRAWVMSGSGAPSMQQSDAAEDNKFVLDETQCADAGCLRNISAEDITTMTSKKWSEEDITNLPSTHKLPYARIVVDGKILTAKVTEALEGNLGSDVPLLIGSAAQSVDANPGPGLDLKSQTTHDFMQYLDTHITEETANEVLAFYNFTSSSDSEYKLTTMISNARLTCGHNKMADKAAGAFTSGVYRYVVKGAPSSEVNAFGESFPAKYAFQGIDLYGFLGGYGGDMAVDAKDSDADFSDRVREMASAFIHEGGMPKEPESWTTYPDGTALIHSRVEISSEVYRKQVCDYWHDNFLQYRGQY